MKQLYSGFRNLPCGIKAASVIGQRLGVDSSFRKAIHLPWFAEKTTGPAVLRTFTLVMCHGLRSRVFSAAAIARRLSEGFAGIAVFFYFSVPRDFPSLCHALCIRNYIRSTERGNLYLHSPFPGVLNNIFELPSDSILNPIRAALTTDCRRYLPHHNDTEVQIGGEGRSPPLFATRTNWA